MLCPALLPRSPAFETRQVVMGAAWPLLVCRFSSRTDLELEVLAPAKRSPSPALRLSPSSPSSMACSGG
jgi:hypothetical protein